MKGRLGDNSKEGPRITQEQVLSGETRLAHLTGAAAPLVSRRVLHGCKSALRVVVCLRAGGARARGGAEALHRHARPLPRAGRAVQHRERPLAAQDETL